MAITRRLVVIVLVALGCVGCDQVSKSVALNALPEGTAWSFLGGTIRLQLAYNTGSFLGLGASPPDAWRQVLFVAGVSGVLIALLAWSLLARKLNGTTRRAARLTGNRTVCTV